MVIKHNVDLKQLNTFQVPALARSFASIDSRDDLTALRDDFLNEEIMVLGGGSNILLTRNFDGLVLKNDITGIEVIAETDSEVLVRSGAGEVWHDLVMHCVDRNFGGLENLSLIPGNVGASPMQNIGAYGVEIQDVFHELEAFHIRDGFVRTFRAEDCRFGYRDSIFKNELKGQYMILSVTFRLSKAPKLNLSYAALRKYLEQTKPVRLSIKTVSDAVIAIRRSKLPDPRELGNAGSFFKNPVIAAEEFRSLARQFPLMPGYPIGEEYKVPAAWLIENCGFKGVRHGNTGCYEKQPLVIVNFGQATGAEILAFSEHVIDTVRSEFGIELSREVNVI